MTCWAHHSFLHNIHLPHSMFYKNDLNSFRHKLSPQSITKIMKTLISNIQYPVRFLFQSEAPPHRFQEFKSQLKPREHQPLFTFLLGTWMNIYNFFINRCHYTLLAPQIPGNFSIFCSPENMLDTTLNLDMSRGGLYIIWQQTPALGLVWFSNRWNCGEQI